MFSQQISPLTMLSFNLNLQKEYLTFDLCLADEARVEVQVMRHDDRPNRRQRLFDKVIMLSIRKWSLVTNSSIDYIAYIIQVNKYQTLNLEIFIAWIKPYYLHLGILITQPRHNSTTSHCSLGSYYYDNAKFTMNLPSRLNEQLPQRFMHIANCLNHIRFAIKV